MILDNFKNLFINSYKNIASLVNSTFNLSKNSKDNVEYHSLDNTLLEYTDNKILANNTGIEAYDFSEYDYSQFHAQFLNNDFFLNEKNKHILEKIHEDLSFIKDIFDIFKLQDIGMELVLTGGAIRDFVLGKSDKIKDLDITINISHNYRDYLMYQGCTSISSVFEVLLKEKNIQYERLLEMTKNFDRIDGYNHLHNLLEDVIEIQGKHFPIQLLCTTNSKTLINNFDFDISKIGVRFFCNLAGFKSATVPSSIEQYVSRLEYGSEFISHAIGKKLSYHNGGKTEQQITSELTYHFPRVALKYPEYSCHIFSPNDENYHFTKQLFSKAQIFNNFNYKLENLAPPGNKTKVRKI